MQASDSKIAQYNDRDGIRYQTYGVEDPRAAVVCIHGLGAHAGRWDFLGAYFRERRIAVYAIELRGFGTTPDIQGHVDSFHVYYRDIQALHAIMCRDHSGIPIFICGESMGGLIAFEAAQRYPSLFRGLIASSPAFKSRMRFSLWTYISFAFACVIKPTMQFRMPLHYPCCTRDTEYQKLMDSDPREHRWATAALLRSILGAQSRAGSAAVRLPIPALFLIAVDDQVVDPNVSKKIFSRIRFADKTLIEYPGMCHTLPVEIGKEKVFKDIEEWIDKHLQMEDGE